MTAFSSVAVVWTGGETVFVPKVERIVGLHARVETCVVVPLPDGRLGEVVTVTIVLGEKDDDHDGAPVMDVVTV